MNLTYWVLFGNWTPEVATGIWKHDQDPEEMYLGDVWSALAIAGSKL